MSSEMEALVRQAFAGIGSYSKLANGFRLQSPHGRSCAVYFSGNAPGNAVEILLSPRALAPVLGRTEAEIATWVRGQAARTRRERVVSGRRGSFPGLALGSGQELKVFLEAWREFARPAPSPAILESTRIEKAAEDAGFDLTPERDGAWLGFGSSALAQRLGVRALDGDTYRVGFGSAAWGAKAAGDCGLAVQGGESPWAAVAVVTGYDALHALLGRAARLARLLSGEAAGKFAGATSELPSATEAERLVVQRVGQDIFRQSLIDYWLGRCAVTGLDVVPLLRASHIKRWADCANDAERLDVYNGLLLAPHVDALFDDGWISFDDAGRVLVCDELSAEQRALLGLLSSWRLSETTGRHRAFLAWHRREVFRSGTDTK